MKNGTKKFFFEQNDNAIAQLEKSQMGKIFGGDTNYVQAVYTESTFVKIKFSKIIAAPN